MASQKESAGLKGGFVAALVLCLGVGLYVALSGPSYSPIPAAAPVKLKIESLGITADVVPIELSSGDVLEPPSDVTDVGWWDQSAEPGAKRGQTVITGHSVHDGGGALDKLSQLKDGDHLDLVTGSGTMRYEVDQVMTATHEQIDKGAENYFGQQRQFSDGPRLVLVTCTDWDGSVWENNLVVFATPLGQPDDLKSKKA